MRQIPSLPDANIRAASYFIARTTSRCRHCGKPTGLLAFAVPDNHETLEEAAEHDVWQRARGRAFIFHVEKLPQDVQFRVKQLSPFYHLAVSDTTVNGCWANHCEHCSGLLDDHELHCEPDVAFMPSSEAAALEISLLRVHAPFEAAAAGYAFEPEFFGHMRKG